ncbi:HAMP domain-containing histidine kinase [Aliiroseovarius sp. S1339]|uniref:sensor histidine kinase n=1 Tax=Aliiroseovarius sp. S1339 TaxID=2936990 RepID=UPI0020C120D1|nr:HAMP domain-containing sensor histidine kinase [Aliiroseovarius sp. S1339]MCK8463137.1 HAMP domain-containing histidine kinase [Aliiroseovarius sp. S1339]
MNVRNSLARRLSRLIIFGFAFIWLLALVATSVVLRHEQLEFADKIIQETAQIYLPAIVSDFRIAKANGDPLPIEFERRMRFDPDGGMELEDEVLVYRLLDRSGNALMVSATPPETVFPAAGSRGYTRTESHVFFTTPPNKEGFVMQVGDLREERSEVFFESVLALVIPMLAILPLVYLTVAWIGKKALSPLDQVRREIEARNDARLDPIDASGQPAELRAITATLNGFMIRLSQALDGERAFATNAAHELRTPVAVALAQVQRMRAEAGGDAGGRLAAIEDALKRMSRLVTRLLQLARAEAGIGMSQDAQDLSKLIDVVLDDSCRDANRRNRLRIVRPKQAVFANIDPDAFAMIAGNLIDNAFQHAPADTPIEVELTQAGVLRVKNDGPVLSPSELDHLPKRFQRGTKTTDGFGLGLYIADKVARHSGGKLEFHSPPIGEVSGFEGRFQAPVHRSDSA